MKINEILVESQQLDEGPLDAIGRGIGKVAGGAAKSVGAVAGGVAGLGKAFMKGYRGGKATVGGDEEGDAPDQGGAAPAADAQPAAGGGQLAAAPKAKAKPKSTFGKLSAAASGGAEQPAAQPAAAAAPAAEPAGGEAPAAAPKPTAKAKAAPAAAPAAKPAAAPAAQPQGDGGTAYAQAQKAVQSLPPEQQKEIVTMLQADPKVKAAMSKPAAPKAKAAPAAQPAAQPAAAPAAEPAPASQPAAEKPGFLKTATDKIQDRSKKKAAKPSQAEIDADRERIMGVTSDSIIRKGLMVSESFSFFRKR